MLSNSLYFASDGLMVSFSIDPHHNPRSELGQAAGDEGSVFTQDHHEWSEA